MKYFAEIEYLSKCLTKLCHVRTGESKIVLDGEIQVHRNFFFIDTYLQYFDFNSLRQIFHIRSSVKTESSRNPLLLRLRLRAEGAHL